MTVFKMENFGGEIPAIDNGLMPDNAGALAINTWLMTGRVEPLHALVPLHTMIDPGARSFFEGCRSLRLQRRQHDWPAVTGWSSRTRTSA